MAFTMNPITTLLSMLTIHTSMKTYKVVFTILLQVKPISSLTTVNSMIMHRQAMVELSILNLQEHLTLPLKILNSITTQPKATVELSMLSIQVMIQKTQALPLLNQN